MLVTITGVGAALQGVGRAEDGRVVFVSGALPGETVSVTPLREKARFIVARLDEVLSPSPDRREPVCPHAARCGGCAAQRMSHEAALALKRQVVTQQLQRLGGLEEPPVLPTLGCPAPWRYRNKAEFSVIADRGGRPVVGMFAEDGETLLGVTDCLLQHEAVAEALARVTAWLEESGTPASDAGAMRPGLRYIVTRVSSGGDMMVILSTVGSRINRPEDLIAALGTVAGARVRSVQQCVLNPRPAHATDGEMRLLSGERVIRETICGLSFDVSAQTFLQVNHAETPALYETALKAAALTGRETVIDAYCGCGTISLMLARQCARVIGVELNRAAVADAKRNARRNGLSDKAEFIADDAAKAVAALMNQGVRPDALVVDPPRKGVHESLLDAVAAARTPRAVYVSCDPGTLARDVKRLTAGGYRMQWAQPVDMFPGTEHVECVTLMTKK